MSQIHNVYNSDLQILENLLVTEQPKKQAKNSYIFEWLLTRPGNYYHTSQITQNLKSAQFQRLLSENELIEAGAIDPLVSLTDNKKKIRRLVSSGMEMLISSFDAFEVEGCVFVQFFFCFLFLVYFFSKNFFLCF